MIRATLPDGRTLILRPWHAPASDPAHEQSLASDEAVRIVSRLDVVAQHRLAASLDLDASAPGTLRRAPAPVLGELLRALREGRLRAWVYARPTPTLHSESEPVETNAPVFAPVLRSWIEIYLLDNSDQPVPNADYIVELPDGGRRTGTLDANGFAREDGIVPGMCQVSFPGLHGPGWHRI